MCTVLVTWSASITLRPHDLESSLSYIIILVWHIVYEWHIVYHISCITYRVSHIVYHISCITYNFMSFHITSHHIIVFITRNYICTLWHCIIYCISVYHYISYMMCHEMIYHMYRIQNIIILNVSSSCVITCRHHHHHRHHHQQQQNE